MNRLEIASTSERINRAVRVGAIPPVIMYRATSRLVGGLGLPKFAEFFLERATSNETKIGNKLTPHAEDFLNKINDKKSGVLFRFATIPLDKREKELAAQLVSDYAEMVKENVHVLRVGFTAIKDKMGTIFSGSNTPPLKPA